MKKLILFISIFFVYNLSFSTFLDNDLYKRLNTPRLDKKVLNRALEGLSKIDIKNKEVLTIIDYTKSANEKRLFVIDLKKEKVIFDTYVSHGKNTGGEFAKTFSNNIDSLQSSVGFFKTSTTYTGRNGYSMRLDGLEKGINDNAMRRNIVIHGAKYATESYINKYGRLGRSWGCPAVPLNLSKDLINSIKGESIVYINGDLNNYQKKTKFYMNF
ncbi:MULTISPECIES: murein L,D-transpeptidase catalytic domain family protein [Psychrilyobacter]|uniref:L,D-transpeptidase catalytic domain n=1 Tax=Psychrilyobacter piezotolerans TaxID=2293438 RepID=A0ABX9KIM2_9FUSO|nr:MULTISPECIES: murein L,D-transpeptidase catalytic domain family protein [Psychrilyobacter]MCS5422854.1 murein L,D-transpeptidase catalytic domain family protein [Psychrilyobacter sp. S5]NDI77393.1 murein L,D-transpeptidase catalytic domain family protein [Psychrilyobacter piezotolerans]RDE63696.1 hypothetical protein DV867_04795 [Psychrilyobacter sp. S5]REI42040.1 hypothetical protein DYH56_04795 [Psychrilyobacter piezotolerans]